ncbi:LysR family transcriptional regulator [Pseudoduganella lutea]|uniref:LysR family transcriptional regulator n=1 Tax=Pseudoduganella lutea TaxID=321985 RepID=A0A4P6L4H3_9BURK|nr:LysR family transcriptional regulator [Pseudoduganella lutea]QBE66489.1 LysR family transcriptional regulator [Pseudoduganella lutea]
MAHPGKIDLNDLLVFSAVAETGGFTTAAARLGVATAKVSVEISRLESKLGLTLFSRTTRKVVLTDAGQALHEDCRPLLLGLLEAIDRATTGEEQLSGTLRISTTVDHAALSLAPALAEFARQHPHLDIDLRTSDRVVDLIEAGIDVSIRLGWLRDSSNRAVKLGGFEQYVVASPAYLARRQIPQDPRDLELFDWIALTLLPAPFTWKFSSAAGETKTIHVKSRVRVDSPGALRSLLQAHTGVSVLDQFNAQDGIASGLLVRLLPEWSLPAAGIYAVYPPGRQVSAKVRTFIDFYRQYLEHRYGNAVPSFQVQAADR